MKQLCLLGRDGAECRDSGTQQSQGKVRWAFEAKEDFTRHPGNNGGYRHILKVVATKSGSINFQAAPQDSLGN